MLQISIGVIDSTSTQTMRKEFDHLENTSPPHRFIVSLQREVEISFRSAEKGCLDAKRSKEPSSYPSICNSPSRGRERTANLEEQGSCRSVDGHLAGSLAVAGCEETEWTRGVSFAAVNCKERSFGLTETTRMSAARLKKFFALLLRVCVHRR